MPKNESQWKYYSDNLHEYYYDDEKRGCIITPEDGVYKWFAYPMISGYIQTLRGDANSLEEAKKTVVEVLGKFDGADFYLLRRI